MPQTPSFNIHRIRSYLFCLTLWFLT
jgi:hypothetical protein